MFLDGGASLCIKKIVNDEMYYEYNYHGERVQNTIEEEGIFLEELENFKINDVFTPKPAFYIETHDFRGIGREQLDAVNFIRVLEGHDEFPANFDLDDYFDRLEKYFRAMHKEKGILHKDVALRNFMIDRETGNPRLIDFGRSKRTINYYAKDETFEEACEKEILALKIAKKDAIDKINKIKGGRYVKIS